MLHSVSFAVSIFIHIGLNRHHRHEKHFGPSPANGYTSGRGRRGFRFWQRNKNTESNPMDDKLQAQHPTPSDYYAA